MANAYQLQLLKEGVEVWNSWRKENRKAEIDLSKADLSKTYLQGADFSKANLSETVFSDANLHGANLSFSNLRKANLFRANLLEANLTGANLTGANLQCAHLVETNLKDAIITDCFVYGLSAWALKGKPKEQKNLVITPDDAAQITVDDLQVAQFIYLLLNHKNLRTAIDNITSKTVLILGRFSSKRKEVLEAIADKLRENKLLPIIFDFEKPESRDYTETVKILAGLSLFVIVDITNPTSTPLELQAIVPDYQIPIVPLLQNGKRQFSMFQDIALKPWVMPLIRYSSSEAICSAFKDLIIKPAINKQKGLRLKKAVVVKELSADDYLRRKGLGYKSS